MIINPQGRNDNHETLNPHIGFSARAVRGGPGLRADNNSAVTQTGTNATATVSQGGEKSESDVTQGGNLNVATVNQDGALAGGKSTIDQSGERKHR